VKQDVAGLKRRPVVKQCVVRSIRSPRKKRVDDLLRTLGIGQAPGQG
jgi:hypothetical protein